MVTQDPHRMLNIKFIKFGSNFVQIKFGYSEKATKFEKNLMAFSEYPNFKQKFNATIAKRFETSTV